MMKPTVAVLSTLLILSFTSGRVISSGTSGSTASSESDDEEARINRKTFGIIVENVGRVLQNDSVIKGMNATVITSLKDWLLDELAVTGAQLNGTDHALIGNTLELLGYLLQDDEQEILEIDMDNEYLDVLRSLGDLAVEVARNETLAV